MAEHIFTNARIVTAEQVIDGTLVVENNLIKSVDTGHCSAPSAHDCEGRYIIPGMVELHTDNMERHLKPRPKSYWPTDSAIMNHDREIAGAGITTVFNALYVGDSNDDGRSPDTTRDACDAVRQARDTGHLKVDHLLHLRCEVSVGKLLDFLHPLLENELAQLISVMDHTPGQRQFVSLEAYATYYQGKYNLNDAEFARFIQDKTEQQKLYSEPNRRAVVKIAHEHDIHLASHDDATVAHVDEAIEDGVSIAEFPTTVEAARASHNAGLAVLMGGPNLVRGKSHSGNASARDFADLGLLDIISSDYVPASMLHAALAMEHHLDSVELPDAVNMVSKTPAEHVGLTDRGELAPGKLADLVVFRRDDDLPIIDQVWRQGARIA